MTNRDIEINVGIEQNIGYGCVKILIAPRYNGYYFTDEEFRKNSLQGRYNFLKRKNPDKSDSWWKNTHGIDFDIITK